MIHVRTTTKKEEAQKDIEMMCDMLGHCHNTDWLGY
jgi:hypothetical protein